MRALVIHSIHGQKHAYTKFIVSSSGWIEPPNFFHILNRCVWKLWDMISCLIWPSINSWRHHNGLLTQNAQFASIMTSADLWKIDCISVNVDQFSFKFWYVLAETILYKCSRHDISFWQRNHGVFLRLKEACQFFTFCVYSLWDMTFSQNWILHSCLLRAISPSFYLRLRWALSML